MLKEKERLDVVLVRLGYFTTRKRAQAAILEGNVLIDGRVIEKAGTSISPRSQILLKKKEQPYVSRGGIKLEKALQTFKISVKNKVVLDVGSSTGGFIDCLLQHGAKQVIGVDVGYGQLAWSLRNDPRVLLMERKNIRYLQPGELPSLVDLITVDVSFISIKKILPVLKTLLDAKGEIIVLVKPQFEAERGTAKKGIIREDKIHVEVLADLWRYLETIGLAVRGLTFSPLAGAEGNIEFLVHLTRDAEASALREFKSIEKVVDEAHQTIHYDK